MCFAKDGLLRPIQGFSFQINTGNHPPILCKPPRYDTHESKVMRDLVEIMGKNDVVEEDDGPWGPLVVTLEKPRQ